MKFEFEEIEPEELFSSAQKGISRLPRPDLGLQPRQPRSVAVQPPPSEEARTAAYAVVDPLGTAAYEGIKNLTGNEWLALGAGLLTPGLGAAEAKLASKGEKLTTSFLNYLKGKTTVSRQEIVDFARRPELKKGEADLLASKLSEFTEQKLPAQEFADSIRGDLLELKPVKVKEPQYSATTVDYPNRQMRWEDRPKEVGKNYEEVVFESPITTNGSSHFPNSKNYFAHARGDEVAEGGKKIWREQEIQSDALQKEGLENIANKNATLEGGIKMTPGESATDFIKRRAELGKQLSPELEKLQPFTNDRFGERIMRERIREKASKGYEKYRLPTGETIGKIQGFEGPSGWRVESGIFGETPLTTEKMKVGMEVLQGNDVEIGGRWVITDILGDGRFKAIPKAYWDDLQKLTPEQKLANKNYYGEDWGSDARHIETFDLTGKSNPQYSRYEKWGKFLKNKYGGKEVIDSQGNKWIEVDLTRQMGKDPVMAYGMTDVDTLIKTGVGIATAAGVGALATAEKRINIEPPIDEAKASGKGETEEAKPEEKVYKLPDRGVEFTGADITELRNVLYSEISNRNQDRRTFESKIIVNTVLNRYKQYRERGIEKSVTEILQELNQYQGFGGSEYKKAQKGEFDAEKMAAIDGVLNELKSGKFDDNTNGSVFYVHDHNGRIWLKPGKLFR